MTAPGASMRILFAATNFTLPPSNGQAMRTLSLLHGLAAGGHDISFIAFAPEATVEAADGLASYCREVEFVARRRMPATSSAGSNLAGRAACVLSRRSYSLSRFRSAAMRKAIARLLETHAFNLVFCDSLYALLNLPATNLPVVLNCHNVEHLIFARYAALNPRSARGWYARIEWRALQRAERRACRRASLALACSGTDRDEFLRLLPDLPTAVVPNVVDTDRLASGNPTPRHGQRPVLLFQGGMDWYPNRDAVEYFTSRILPMIRSERPDVKFLIAGRNPPRELVERLSSPAAVEFTGTVPDMLPHLQAATLAVVPLRVGSGTRLKILEACAAGKAVVSTGIGAEGLDLRPGHEILLADQPAEFAQHVLHLLRDPARREAVAAAGKAAVHARYGNRALQQTLQTALAQFEPGAGAVRGGVGAWGS